MASWDIYYKVFITPRIDIYKYASEIDVSDHIDIAGVSTIDAQIDSTDYDIGAFKYSDVTLKGLNKDGYFNDETDIRSIFFPFSRDLAKVRIVFTNSFGDTIVFRGLINEEATVLDFKNDVITLLVLSLDSAIRNTQVAGGTVTSGILCSNALSVILNVPSITSVLNYNVANINVDQDFIIDDGTKFDNLNTRDVLNNLLLASDSVMTIDLNQNMIIQGRSANLTSTLNLYGPYDEQRRQNVVDLKDYNSGKQRMFNSFLVNKIESTNNPFVQQFGFRQKSLTFDFITSDTTAAKIGSALLKDFQLPKIELTVDVPTAVVKNSVLLDPVSLNWPLLITPVQGTFMPVVGDAVIDDASRPIPNMSGSLKISPNVAFKIIELIHDPSTFVSTLKLRQQGTDFVTGYFTQPGQAVVGFGKIDDAVVQSGPIMPAALGNFIGQAVVGTQVVG